MGHRCLTAHSRGWGDGWRRRFVLPEGDAQRAELGFVELIDIPLPGYSNVSKALRKYWTKGSPFRSGRRTVQFLRLRSSRRSSKSGQAPLL